MNKVEKIMEVTEEKKEDNHIQNQPDLPKQNEYYFLHSRSERFIFLILCLVLAVGPILFLKSIPSHADWHIHMERAYNFKRCFWQGQYYPRWIDAQGDGYGLPVFNFYAPLIYYLYVVFDLIFRNAILSIKWVFIAPVILTTICGYLYLRRHGSAVATTIALIFVIFSPALHIYTYNTNWPNSVLAIAFVYLTLYGLDTFNKNKNIDVKSLLITSFGYAGIVLSHIATAFCFTLLSVPYFFLSVFVHKTRNFLKNFILSLGLGAALSGFYLIPASLEKKFVHADEVIKQGPLWDYLKNFLYTFLDRDKNEGYAWSMFDHRYYETSNAVFGIAILLCMLFLIFNMEKVKIYFKESFRINSAITMFVISFLMMTPASFFIWIMIKPLHTIQFPWRFTTFTLIFGSLVMMFAFDLMKTFISEKIKFSGYKFIFLSMISLLSLLIYLDYTNMFHWKWVNEESLLKSATSVLWSNQEYRPSLNNDPNWKSFEPRQDFSTAINSSSSNLNIKLLRWTSYERMFEVFSPISHKIRLRTFYFPGWNVYVDKSPVNIDIETRTGAIYFEVPAGQHEIKVVFEQTQLRKTATYVSFGALIVFIYLLMELVGSKKKNMKIVVKDENKENTSEAVSEVTV